MSGLFDASFNQLLRRGVVDVLDDQDRFEFTLLITNVSDNNFNVTLESRYSKDIILTLDTRESTHIVLRGILPNKRHIKLLIFPRFITNTHICHFFVGDKHEKEFLSRFYIKL